MSLEEKLLKEFQTLSEANKLEVLDFVEFLKTKSKKQLEGIMDNIIEQNREALEELAK
ncbi:DUF2281 domain-containing protein [Ammoniphilus resinae]|uniref:Ribosomal silencing factor RsfS n=1 Tax=Ammoniphilus resinae TaxID=861532 RepID=A0ABS4GSJ0_9BACL|nr:DUF2281 domain-containing protein [Ammoniphilus resinae]MBP1933233.1 ribosomal silencing factor RsfS [Ammoniphilus resinae]